MKNEYITIHTKEQLKIRYQIASPLARFLAFVMDYVFFYALMLVIYLVLVFVMKLNSIGNLFDSSVSISVMMFFYIVIFFLLKWGYFAAFEYFLNGKTPGKLITKIRVINYYGEHLDLSSVVLRNFLRIIDQDITFLLGAITAMVFTKHFRRIGDIVGETVVIRDEQLPKELPDFDLNFSHRLTSATSTIVAEVSEYELFAIRQFLNSLPKFTKEKRIYFAKKIERYIKNKLHDPTESRNPFEYIKSIYLKQHNGN